MTNNSAFAPDQFLTTDLGADIYGTFPDQRDSQSTTTTTTSFPHAPTVILLGGCPACKTGKLETDFTCFGLCCAIFFFPIGLICCYAFRQHRCNFCGAIFP